MQPFKNDGRRYGQMQKGLAYSIQSSFVMREVWPWDICFVYLRGNRYQQYRPPKSLPGFCHSILSISEHFILILCVLYTSAKVKEFPPEEYAEYHGITNEEKKGTKHVQAVAQSNQSFLDGRLGAILLLGSLYVYGTYTNGTGIECLLTLLRWKTMAEGTAKVVLDTQSIQYQNAADWVGILFAVQAISSVIWAAVIPVIKNKVLPMYSAWCWREVSSLFYSSTINMHYLHPLPDWLCMGGNVGFAFHYPWPMRWQGGVLIWGSLTKPSASRKIVAASLGGMILKMFTTAGNVAPEVNMLVLAGIFLIIGAGCRHY